MNFCDRLEGGDTPFNIMLDDEGPVPEDGTVEGGLALMVDWVESGCPQELESNQSLRDFLSSNGFDLSTIDD